MSMVIENLSFRYGPGSGGVDKVSFEIGDGELMALIGPSGCGKSTVLKLIAGFMRPDSGRILLGGADCAQVPTRQRDIGIVFQNYALFPHMTLAENVGYPLKLRNVPRQDIAERVRAGLEMVGLAHLAERTPRALSGGQQQRIALARALVFRPRALLLDEPLSALDAALRIEMRDEISRLQKHYGIATLHITHDQEEAMSIADKLAVMKNGRMLQIGRPREIYAQPASRDVAAFVGQANLLDGSVSSPGVVETALGPLTVDTGRLAAQTPVCILIRPERIDINPANSAQNRVAGATTRDRYLGSLRRLDFTTDAGFTLLIETDDMELSPTAVSLPPEALQLLEENISRDSSASHPETMRT